MKMYDVAAASQTSYCPHAADIAQGGLPDEFQRDVNGSCLLDPIGQWTALSPGTCDCDAVSRRDTGFGQLSHTDGDAVFDRLRDHQDIESSGC
jgi:hypothetical protein